MNGDGYNIHDRARQMQAQSRSPIDISSCYRELTRRAAKKREQRALAAHLSTIETPTGPGSWKNIPQQTREIRLPYRDD